MLADERIAALGLKAASEIEPKKPNGLNIEGLAANRDGNTVELENELMELNQNTLSHALETHLVTGTLLKMRLAITGKAA